MAWWVSAASAPPDTEEQLRVRGGKRIDTVQILACELTVSESPPRLGVPADVTVELVTDERTFRAASRSPCEAGAGRSRPKQPSPVISPKPLRDVAAWTNFRVLASLDGKPACTGGATLNGAVAQLWGAVTLPEFRHRGTYRAVLAERLRLARDHRAELALVKGRAETSGPILLRAGFTGYGEERCYWLSL